MRHMIYCRIFENSRFVYGDKSYMLIMELLKTVELSHTHTLFFSVFFQMIPIGTCRLLS